MVVLLADHNMITIEEFAEQFRKKQLTTGCTDLDIARLAMVPVSLVMRWKQGISRPAPAVEAFIFDKMEELQRNGYEH